MRRLHFFHDWRERRNERDVGVPCGAEDDAEDEGAQGARVRERHGMRERPIPLGDLRQSHVAGCLCQPAAGEHRNLLSASTDQARLGPLEIDSRVERSSSESSSLGHRARAVAAAPSGKRPKTDHHGEGARSRRLDRQGTPRVEPSLAARRRRVSPPPRARVFILGGQSQICPATGPPLAHPSPFPPSIPSADLARVASLASRSRRSSSASRWRSPSWSPSAATSRSCSWRRATCSR